MNLGLDSPCWDPFRVSPNGGNPDPPRSLETFEGMGDRLRAAAFAELQAREAFLSASDRFVDAPQKLRWIWKKLALDENKHLNWLLERMKELHIEVQERMVSEQLWISFYACQNSREFSEFMSNAEERGRKAGERFYLALLKKDPVTAQLFKTIAEEERGHIALARAYLNTDVVKQPINMSR